MARATVVAMTWAIPGSGHYLGLDEEALAERDLD
jgi:hypothetical protein